jgi:hypothetical protein
MSIVPAFAQEQDKASVKAVIDDLFVAMQKGDSAQLRKCFAAEVSLASIFRNKNGEAVNRREHSIAGFAKAVGTPHKETWYEEYWNLRIDIDGDFASVWCDYAFYLDKTFSHCGVDSFHLFREKDGWKIFHLSDTRRKEGCNVPADIIKRHQ